VAIRRSVAGDLYLTLAVQPKDVGSQNASLEIFVNPLVDWIWFGFGIMAIGTGIALLPEESLSFALAKVPAGAATTGALLLVLLFSGATLFAQEPGDAPIVPRTPLEQQLHGEINCACGGCFGPLKDCPMMYCATRQKEKGEIRDLVDRGQSHDQIIATFVERYGGQQVLNAPIDKGFNRLAWMIPSAVGLGGMCLVGFVAIRWSRRREDELASTEPPEDPSVKERLDDELRDLD
jgi:hypothetical protein